MNKRQIADAALCEKLDDKGGYKDCSSCSCSVCIAQEPKVFTPNDYQIAALRTANTYDPKDLILNGILGLCGETGEVSDLLKKHLFQGHALDRNEVIKELGDICWYLAITAQGIGVNLETVMKVNIEKLKKRYPNGFDVEKSINRKDVD